MRNTSGFSLIQLMIAVAIMGILAIVSIPDLRTAIFGAKETTVYQQTSKFEEAIGIWISDQPSTAAAAKLFNDTGTILTPKDPQALVDIVNSLIDTTKDKFIVEDGKILTEAMRPMKAYIEVTWPKPYRHNHVRVNLSLPTAE